MYNFSKLRERGLVLILLIILLGCFCSCSETKSEKPENDTYTINVEAIINNPQKISLSEIGSNIAYVPLETNNNSLLGPVNVVQITKSFIFVSDNKKLLQFDRKGNYIRQIGKIGNGPGEYSRVTYFSVNELANTILLPGAGKYIKYDLAGNFIGDVPKSYGIDFIFYRPDRIAFYHSNNIEDPTNLTITKQNFSPVARYQNANPRPKTNMGIQSAPLYVFRGKLYFKEHYNDTLFCVEDSLLKPHIIYKEKGLLLDKNFELHSTGDISDLIKQLDKVKDKLRTEKIFEGGRFVLTSYLKGMDPRNVTYTRILYDKVKNEAHVVDNGEFMNDIDGGADFWPKAVFQDSIMVNYQNAVEFKDYVASDAFKNATPKYPEKKRALEQLADSLTVNDNPILMLVKLKE